MNNFILTLTCLVTVAFFPAHSFAAAKFKITTYNVRNFSTIDEDSKLEKSITSNTDAKALFEVLSEVDSDILAFQEIINGTLFRNLLSKKMPNHELLISECGGTADQKVALAYNSKKFKLISSEEDWRVSLSTRCNYGLRPALVTVLRHKVTGKRVGIVVVHLKAGSGDRNRNTRREQHEVLSVILSELESQRLDDVIILGDFNTTSYFEQTPGAAQFEDFMKNNDLRNSSASVSCTSFWQGDRGDGNMWPSHLDHVLHKGKSRMLRAYSGAHCARSACQPTPKPELGDSFNTVSDHCPVQVEFRYPR
ncbi:MAG: endonuclease/exonuclease/phosphatase family protein [bacterium]